MKILVNGDDAEVADAISISDLLEARKVKMPDMVSVELNGEIVDRSTFADTTLKEGDKVEFLYFMGGGAAGGRGSLLRSSLRLSFLLRSQRSYEGQDEGQAEWTADGTADA